MIQYAESLYALALKSNQGTDIEGAKHLAKRCGQIIKRIFSFDPDNQFAADLQVDLYLNFNIEITKLD